jgi:hypothetical protein
MRIDFKSLRHYKATLEYHKTNDILYVKELLGHRSLKNTLVYIHLTEFEEDDHFIVKIASTVKEFTELLEKGFARALREICDIEDHERPYYPSQLSRFRNRVGPERLEGIMNELLGELLEGSVVKGETLALDATFIKAWSRRARVSDMVRRARTI